MKIHRYLLRMATGGITKAISRPSSSSSLFPTQKYSQQLPPSLNVLSSTQKFRINELRLQRIGLKPAKIECIRELEVINALDDTKLLFIHQHHAMRVERYEMKVYTFSPNESSPESGPCLLRMVLERSHPLHTVTARIYSPPETPLAYVYDLEGVRRTAIIEDGDGVKCLYQLQTKTPSGWTKDAKIYSAAGNVRLGHIVKLDPRMITDINIYLRLHPEFDIASKCILIGAAMFLMTYDYVR